MSWQERKTLDGQSYYYNPSTEDITWTKPEELQTSEERELARGDWTWVPHPVDLWQPAQKTVNGDGSADCVTERGERIFIPKNGTLNSPLTHGKDVVVPLWPLNRTYLRFQEDDLVMLDELNEALIMHNLRTRYRQNQLYTWVGATKSVLVSVNPYKMLPLYSSKQIELYRNKPPNTKLDPHVFDIANDSYNSLLFSHRNQSVLISGESGAGKTVATKHCLKFLAQVAGSERNVEERVVLANPILEAFGNAQTIRNNNSSRFGKWIQIYFDSAQRAIVSAEIINYLLEKSRLIGQQKGERNYHIFYQLTKDRGAMQTYGLSGPQNYRYTNVSGTYDAHLIDDVEDFQEVNNALKQLGFSSDEENFLFSIAAAILQLGNCAFDKNPEKNNVMGSKLSSKSKNAANSAAQLLGLPAGDLIKVLSYRSISVRGVTNTIPLNPDQARSSCDSLAMGIYSRMFDWLVQRINVSLQEDASAKAKASGFIGILDIFGFEIFEQNSFEQLCINFANEKLQQQFNRTTFKEEEQLYQSEGISYTKVEFIDNQNVCDLIEAKNGLLPMLDDETLIPEGSDVKYMNRIEAKHQKNEKFQTDTHRKLDNSFNFEIVHYAGIVKYNGEGFLAKNKDSMFADQKSLCNNSSNGFVKSLFVTKNNGGKAKSTGTKSLSHQFRGQLNDLMKSLYNTDSRYIRCVKPNQEQRPDSFVSVLVNDQLKYSGVYEAVEIRRQGFPFRLTYAQFACKYSCINMRSNKHVAQYRAGFNNPKALCKEILDRNRFDFSSVVFGKTMCLYKTQSHRLLTLLRELNLAKLIPVAQAVMKGHLAREMRRRCHKCDEEINRALRVGNDIDLLDQALNKIPSTIGSLAILFPGVEPSMKSVALERRKALLRWKELEVEFERLVQINGGVNEVRELKGLLNEAEQILDTPRTDKQINLYDEAQEHYKALDIKVQNERIEQNIGKFSSLGNFSKMRDPDEYVKKVLMSKKGYKDVMYTWQKSKLPTSLTNLPAEPELLKRAKACFEAIKEYSGQKKSKMDTNQMVQVIFSFGKESAETAEELWVQLQKMVTNNPNEEFATRVWDLIAMAIYTVPVSEELEDYLILKLREAPNGTGVNFTSAYHAVKYDKAGKDNVDTMMPTQVAQFARNRYSTRL